MPYRNADGSWPERESDEPTTWTDDTDLPDTDPVPIPPDAKEGDILRVVRLGGMLP